LDADNRRLKGEKITERKRYNLDKQIRINADTKNRQQKVRGKLRTQRRENKIQNKKEKNEKIFADSSFGSFDNRMREGTCFKI
jgi:hypothetical protein